MHIVEEETLLPALCLAIFLRGCEWFSRGLQSPSVGVCLLHRFKMFAVCLSWPSDPSRQNDDVSLLPPSHGVAVRMPAKD